MERLKPLAEILSPDERNLGFVRVDTQEPQTLEQHHAAVALIALSPDVPEQVRSYFSTVQNVLLYAWFAYDMYPVAAFLSYTAIEMSLRARFPGDRRSLGTLLDLALKQKLIRPKRLPHIREQRRERARFLRMLRTMPFYKGVRRPQANNYKSMFDALRYLRNSFAHPKHQTILFPGQAISQVWLAAQLINDLFQGSPKMR